MKSVLELGFLYQRIEQFITVDKESTTKSDIQSVKGHGGWAREREVKVHIPFDRFCTQRIPNYCLFTSATRYKFGRIYVVKPKGRHLATVVWLHDLGDKGSSWSQLLGNLPLQNVKWICPTAPTRPVTLFGGFPSTTWFDAGDFSEDALSDFDGLDASAAYIADLLAPEPPDVKLAVGGFSMGAATALYSATRQVLGHHANGDPYPINLGAIIGLNGWLPCSSSLKTMMKKSEEACVRAASLPILLCHGLADEVVAFEQGQKSAETLTAAGFENLTFKGYEGLGHYTIPEETIEMCNWLTETLDLDGASNP